MFKLWLHALCTCDHVLVFFRPLLIVDWLFDSTDFEWDIVFILHLTTALCNEISADYLFGWWFAV